MPAFDWNNLFNLGGNYYLGDENIKRLQALGEETQTGMYALGDTAFDKATFKPYTVTSGLGNVGTTAEGGFDINLSPEQQMLQSGLLGSAQGLSENLGGAYNPLAGQIGQQAYGQAQQQLGQATSYDPSLAAQRGAIGGIFGQQLGQYGQPTGMEGLTQAGLGGAMSQFGAAGQPADIQALRQQYGNLASQAGQGLLSSPEQRQSDIYESIRDTQRPEEQRQNLALEERLLGQGRLGISTDAYGGTPEQLAMAKAQAEAGNTAALMARQQAMSEQQQALANAQSLTSLTSGLAGLGSDLETAGISRGSSLANVGLAGQQAGQQMSQQQLSNLMSLQGADQNAALQQQALQSGSFNLGSGLFGLGNQASQLPAQLQGQDLTNVVNMMNAGYTPQQQALAMLQGSAVPAGFADVGRRTGTNLFSQLQQSGLEARMQSEKMANDSRLQQQQALLSGLTGDGNSDDGVDWGALWDLLKGG
tara:strand:- start:2 stop:1429 length:1428 start_codon:yes stop_codon:yes gene_type:complete